MQNSLTINCDGGSRGNPGPAACAFVATDAGNVIYRESKFLGVATNNDAEYSAVILALKWFLKSPLAKRYISINFILDSELVVRQIKGVYKIKSQKLREHHTEIIGLIKKLGVRVEFQNVEREKNKLADDLVNEELDRNETA